MGLDWRACPDLTIALADTHGDMSYLPAPFLAALDPATQMLERLDKEALDVVRLPSIWAWRSTALQCREGGAAGFGLRRYLVDEHRQPKAVLSRGEQKSLQTDRVILKPGPPEEVEVVRRLYRMFVVQRRTETEIAAALNEEGILTDLGRPWTRGTVHQVLTNEKYIGNNVYNRASFKLKAIRQRRHLLSGISADVAELLKDKPVGHHAFQKLRKMKPIRQLEVAELMVSANNYTVSYAKALLATSKPADLHKPDELKKATGLSAEQMARLEREMASVSEDYKELEASYGDDMLVLVVASGFIERLLSKPEIEGFLERRHPEFLENFRAIVQATSLDQSTSA